MNVFASTVQAGRNLGLTALEMRLLQIHARRLQALFDRLQKAVQQGNKRDQRQILHQILRSFSAKVCAVARTIQPETAQLPITLEELERRASMLNPFRTVPGRVIVKLKPKHDGGWRPVAAFGWQRRALMCVCVDILQVVLPHQPFDFLQRGKGGVDKAIMRLQELLDSVGSVVVTADIANCFGSVDQKKVTKLIALPKSVVRHVLLLGEEAKVKVKCPEGVMGFPPGSPGTEADEAVRQGLPQGCPASGLIVRRAILGPMLAALPFADRLVLFQDEVAVVAKDKAEAEVILTTLRSILSANPAGPLTIGHERIRHIEEGFDFLGYFTQRKPPKWGGKLHSHPSARAYRRAEQISQSRFDKAGDPIAGLKAISTYIRQWRTSFRLWKPNYLSKSYQWFELMARLRWRTPKIE